MRVLHIDTGREMRGGQRQVLLLMKGLRERGHHSELLARQDAPLWAAAKSLGFPVRPGTLSSVRSGSYNADLVHVHDARAHTLAAMVARKPVVVSRRVAFPVKSGVFSRWKYGRARRYLAVSRFVAQELVRAGIPTDKIDVVYDGFERTVAPVPSNFFRVVALDSADPAKGRTLVAASAEKAGIAVQFSENLAVDMPSASLFVYATQSEGLGSAALFAMSLEVPVIASRVGGLPEIIEHGQTGLLVDNDTEAFADAMKRLKDDPETRERMGRAARVRVESGFTAEQMVEGTLAAYERALRA